MTPLSPCPQSLPPEKISHALAFYPSPQSGSWLMVLKAPRIDALPLWSESPQVCHFGGRTRSLPSVARLSGVPKNPDEKASPQVGSLPQRHKQADFHSLKSGGLCGKLRVDKKAETGEVAGSPVSKSEKERRDERESLYTYPEG